MKKLFITIMTLLFLSGMVLGQEAVMPTSGDGSSGSPYQIATWQNLYWISQNTGSWNKYFVQTADIDFADADPAINTWNSNTGWTPIGNSSTNFSFSGSYDGQGYTISGLFINRSSPNYQGLFGYTKSATISNLRIAGVSITATTWVGALVGWSESTTITNCSSTGSVTGTGYYIGGLTGKNTGDAVTNSYSLCTVTGAGDVGGFTGALAGGSIGRSYSKGNVNASDDWAGGFLGYINAATITDCYSTRNTTRTSGSDTYFGAFCGYSEPSAQGTFQKCYTTGSVYYTGSPAPTDKGFNGNSSGTFSGNFFDSDVSNQNTATGATAKTTVEMKTLSTFTSAGWDFELETTNGTNDYWDLDYSGTINDGYPYLSWQDGEDRSLPVELTDFAAVAQSGGVVLTWTTESETENLGFILERNIVGANHDLPSDWSQITSYVTDEALAGHGSTSEAHEYVYTDAAVVPGETYLYRLGDVDYSGSVTWHKEVEVKVEVQEAQVPLVFGLQPAYPNPFNPSVTIPYGLTEDGNISLKVYNLRGELVKVLISTYALKGTYSMKWSPQNLSAGVYIVRIQAGNLTAM